MRSSRSASATTARSATSGTRPRRLQRSRAKGWRSPPGAVYVGRPSRYGNPFHVDRDLSAERAVRLFRDLVLAEWTRFEPLLAELRGKDLLCWCSLDAPCHADVLLELANR